MTILERNLLIILFRHYYIFIVNYFYKCLIFEILNVKFLEKSNNNVRFNLKTLLFFNYERTIHFYMAYFFLWGSCQPPTYSNIQWYHHMLKIVYKLIPKITKPWFQQKKWNKTYFTIVKTKIQETVMVFVFWSLFGPLRWVQWEPKFDVVVCIDFLVIIMLVWFSFCCWLMISWMSIVLPSGCRHCDWYLLNIYCFRSKVDCYFLNIYLGWLFSSRLFTTVHNILFLFELCSWLFMLFNCVLARLL